MLFGVAVFLIFVLVAGETAGALGRGTGTGLSYAFGRLAFLLPLTLLILAVTSFMDVRLRYSYWLAGALLFLLGLFLLLAAGFPPFGSHAEETFVREVFQVRAGGLGEALYALFRGAVGTVGVAIVGWVTLLAGFSLATGMTVRRMGRGTRRAAEAVMSTAERSTLVMRRREARSAWDEETTYGAARSADGFGDLLTARWMISFSATAPQAPRAPCRAEWMHPSGASSTNGPMAGPRSAARWLR